MDRGLGARLTVKRLRTDRFTRAFEAPSSAEAVTSWVVAALDTLGRPLVGPELRAVIGAGFRNLNPALVEVHVEPLDPHRTRVTVIGVAKEGLVGQRTAGQAAGRVLDALGAGRRRRRSWRERRADRRKR